MKKLYKFHMVSEAFIEADSMEEAVSIAEDMHTEIHDDCVATRGFDVTEDDVSSLEKDGWQEVHAISVIIRPGGRITDAVRTESQADYLERYAREEAGQ